MTKINSIEVLENRLTELESLGYTNQFSHSIEKVLETASNIFKQDYFLLDYEDEVHLIIDESKKIYYIMPRRKNKPTTNFASGSVPYKGRM